MPFVETRIRISMAALAKMVCGGTSRETKLRDVLGMIRGGLLGLRGFGARLRELGVRGDFRIGKKR